jgi:glutaredoxin
MEKDILIISLPNCSKCDEIKSYLKKNNIPYTDKMLDTDIQTELIMNNIYSNPPNIKVDGKYFSYKNFKENPDSIFKSNDEESSCYQK